MLTSSVESRGTYHASRKSQVAGRPGLGTAVLLAAVLVCAALTTLAADEPFTGFSGGLVVQVGCGDLQRLARLASRPNVVAQVLDRDETAVAAARKALGDAYGPVTVAAFDGEHLPYISNLVSLLILDGEEQIPDAELVRVLAPRGVVMMRSGRDTGLVVMPVGQWLAYTKPVPADIDDWSHWLHDPSNNAVSLDRRVGISRHLQWTMPPRWGRNHNLMPSVSAMVSEQGRLTTIIDEAPVGVKGTGDRWTLICRDAFNGIELWRKPVPDWGWKQWSEVEFGIQMRFKGPHQLFRRLAAVDETLYVTLGFTAPVTAIDGRSGEVVRVYRGTENTAVILATDTTLYLTRNVLGDTPGKTVLAVDAASGRILWENRDLRGVTARGDETKRFTDTYLTLGDNMLFLLDGDHILGVDAASGKEMWRQPRPVMEKGIFGHSKYNFRNLCSLAYHAGTVVLAQTTPSKTNLNKWQQKDIALVARDAMTGKLLWEGAGMTLAHFTPPDLFINRGQVWTLKKDVVSLLGLDLRTGVVRNEFPVKNLLIGHHHRCYRNKATTDLYLCGEEGIEYIDFRTGKLDVHHWMRGACAYGILPANGLIYLPTHTCGCHANIKLNGFIALAAAGPSATRPTPAAQRLVRGPAYGASGAPGPDAAAWPAFRRDGARSNHLPAPLPSTPTPAWRVPVGRDPTPPVVAAGRVVVADKHNDRVICLDAETGREQWHITVDGRVDTPPTFHRDRFYFGTRAGSVYAVDAATGQLAWRFAAAPGDEQIMAFGRLESVWPVSGSVLIKNNTVYVVAGRSMHLNGGIVMLALDAATGAVKQTEHLVADTKPKGETAGAVLPDLLVDAGDTVSMRGMHFNIDDISRHQKGSGGPHLVPADGGLLDRNWYNSAFWRYMNVSAQMLAFDDTAIYGIAAYKKQVWKSAAHDARPIGSGYRLSAYSRQTKSAPVPAKGKGVGKKAKARKKKAGKGHAQLWEQTIPLRAECLVSGRERIYVAGAPDTAPDGDPWASFDGRSPGVVQVHSKADGTKISECPLPAPPVYDGLAAAPGSLYVSLKNGTVVCLR